MITKLLKNGDRVTGAVGVNVRAEISASLKQGDCSGCRKRHCFGEIHQREFSDDRRCYTVTFEAGQSWRTWNFFDSLCFLRRRTDNPDGWLISFYQQGWKIFQFSRGALS